MLRKMIVAGMLAYGALACGPGTTTNNYYGSDKNGSPTAFSSGGNYSCQDAGDLEYLCLKTVDPNGKDTVPETVSFIINICNACGFDQSCLSCIASNHCKASQSKAVHQTPLRYCISSDQCPQPPTKSWGPWLSDPNRAPCK